MPDRTRSHLRIAAERIRQEPFIPQAGGTAFTRENHEAHGRHLLAIYETLSREIQDLDDARHIFLQVELHQDRAISSERQHLAELGFYVVAVSPTSRNIGIARITRARFYGLEERLNKYTHTRTHRGKSYFAPIEYIGRVPANAKFNFEALNEREPLDFLISLHPSLPIEMQEAVAGKILLAVRAVVAESSDQEGENIRIRRYVDGVVSIAVKLTRVHLQEVVEPFSSILFVESNAAFVSESSTPAISLPPVILIGEPKCSEVVVVIDSGVNPASNLLRHLVTDRIPRLPDNTSEPHWDHGTFVASRVVYGDDLIDALSSRIDPWCRVIDVPVTGVDAVGNKVLPQPDALAAIIQEVVPLVAQRSRVINISLGQGPIVTRQFSRLAAILDYLSRQFGILFVISAGNITPLAAPPSHFLPESARTKSPGEALLALTVGSIAKTADASCEGCIQGISPFSCRGPGADEGYKPEVVAHGGNAAFSGDGWISSFKVGVHGISQDGQSLAYACGTSFSAPIIAQYAARLFDAYPSISSNMVRALLCHFTDPIVTPTDFPLPPHTLSGFGEPSMNRALFSVGPTSSYLYEGVISPGSHQFIPFYIPQAFAHQSQHLRVRVTIAFDPPVDFGNAAEYSKARLICCLRKRLRVGMREIQVGGAEDDHRLPWNPIVQFTKPFRRDLTAGEWELKVRLMTRGDLTSDFSQRYATVIEIIDPHGTMDVREAILQETGGAFVPISLQVAA